MKNATVTTFQRKSTLSFCMQNALVLAGLLAAACMVSSASAATIVWSGGDLASGNTNWSDAANWNGGVVPGITADVKLYDLGAVTAVSNIDNIVDANTTIASLQYGSTNGNHTTWITNGATLNVTGGLTVGTLGTPSINQKVYATVIGMGGTLNITNNAAYIVIDQGTNTVTGGANMRATLDMSGLDTFAAKVYRIGVGDFAIGGANNAQSATGTLLLAKTNTITTISIGSAISANPAISTNAVVVGCDNGNAGGVNYLYLGQTNGFYIDSIGVGTEKATGSLLFNPGLANPTAYFRGTNGANNRIRFWTIADMSSSGNSSANCNGTNDFTGGTVDILVDTMSLGRDRQGGNTGSSTTMGTLIFTAGMIDVNTIYVGNQFFSTTGNSNPMAGLVNVNGPSATLKVNTSLVLGNTTVISTAAQKTVGTLQINGGTVLANRISVGGNSAAANTITMTNGTLAVSNTIASPPNALSVFSITNSTLNLNVLNATTNICVTNFTTSGSVVINIGSAPVFPSYPTKVVLVKYFSGVIGGGGYGALSLGSVPANIPGAVLSNDVANSSVVLVLPTDPRPSITGVSSSYAGSPGDNVTFTVSYTGVSPLTVQWQENGTNVVDGPTGSGSTNYNSATTTFSITNAQASDSGSYAAVVTNAYGSITSSPPTVLVISAGDVAPLVTGPNNQTVIKGNTAVIMASVAGKPVPAVQWQFNGTNLTDGLQGDGSTISGSANSVLTINNAQYPSDQGPYSLIASNSAGMVTNSMTLTVIVPPSISGQPQSLVVTNTQSASFSVTAAGVPNPTYQWFKNGNSILGETNATYVITSTSSSSIATYYAQISNAAGSTNSASVTLIVNSIGLTPASLTPANGAPGICYDTPLYLTFSQAPTLINVGKIRIYNVSNPSTPVDTLDMSQNQNLNSTYAAAVQSRNIGGDTFNSFPVIITGNTAAIYPHLNLLTSNQTYYVTIDDGVFTDSSGAYFPGISATNVWQFTTRTGGPNNPTNLFVAADGSGDFLTVQGAVDSVTANNTTPTFINIQNGFYTEIVDVKLKNNLDFRGQTRTGAKIGYPNNNNVNPTGAPLRAMFVLNGNNCTFENLTITNTTPKGGSQAEAIDVEGTQCTLYNMELDSYQDTFLVHSAGKLVYFQDCLVQGDTDFNWGYGTVFYTNCEIRMLTSGGHVTQPRSPIGQNGFSFVNCRITAGSGSVTSGDLGRSISTPTTPSEVIFSHCLMGDFITGYLNDAGTNFWDYADSNLTATVSKTLANSTHLTGSETILTAALNATNWLYGWQPQVAPNILTNPVSQSISGGGTATFTNSATGIGAPTYQWLKNGNPIPGQTNSSLTISNASANDAASYSVIVSNSAGVVTSSSASLIVGNTAPTLTPVSDQTVNVGVNVSIANVPTDPDVPAQTLTFTLLTGPSGASVDSVSGNFTWRPTVSTAGTTNPVQVVVSDNGSPNLSATNNFNVIVNPLTQPSVGSSTYSGGQFTVNVNGLSGPDYAVQVSTNLTLGGWTTIFSTNSPAMPFTFTDTNAGMQSIQFYRIVTGPPLP